MGVLDQFDDQKVDRFYDALQRKLGELAAEFPELEAAGQKLDPDTLAAPVRLTSDEEREARRVLMARAERVIARSRATRGDADRVLRDERG